MAVSGQDNEELDAAVAEANVFALVSHQYWGIWALVQASTHCIQYRQRGMHKELLLTINEVYESRCRGDCTSCSQTHAFMFDCRASLGTLTRC